MGKIWKKSKSSSSGSKLRSLTIYYAEPSPRNPCASSRRSDDKTPLKRVGRTTR